MLGSQWGRSSRPHAASGLSPAFPGRDGTGEGWGALCRSTHYDVPCLCPRPGPPHRGQQSVELAGRGRWKFTWNWLASLPGQQMLALEPGWGSLQAVGGRHLQMISRVGFLVGSAQGLSLWGPSGLQDSSHRGLFTRCHVRARPAELAAPPPRRELPALGAGSLTGCVRPG